MLVQRKALYNLLQLNLSRIESGELKVGNLKKWQITDYRSTPSEELFLQLRELNIPLSPEQFEALGKNFEAPEEMVEHFSEGREPLEKDQTFLILFELWRRFFPERRTLSIFCDELDHQMIAYDLGKPNDVGGSLAYLQQVLEEHADHDMEPRYCFELLQTFCANDIESFLFDFILNAIEEKNYNYATEVLEAFKPFVRPTPWFDYLAARATILKDPVEGYEDLEDLVDSVQEETPRDLVSDMLFFLANSGNHSLFYKLGKKMIPLLKNEKEFQEFLEACYSHYDYLELKQPSLAIALLYHNRSAIAGETPLAPSDKGLMEMRAILDQKLHFAEE